MSKNLKFVLSLIVLCYLPLAGCDSNTLARAVLPIADSDTQREAAEKIKELCEREAGNHIYRTVDDVSGFVLMDSASYRNGREKPSTDSAPGGCSGDCVNFFGMGYSYIEATYRKPIAKGLEDIAAEPGIYRYRLINVPDARCAGFDKRVKESVGFKYVVDQNLHVLAGKCIYAEPIESLRAPYSFEPLFDEWIEITKGNWITVFGSRVLDRHTGKEIAVHLAYEVRNRKYINRSLASCGYDSELDIRTVLKPRG